MREEINRLKVILAEKNKTNKWLAKQMGLDQAPFLNGVIAVSSLVLRHSKVSRITQRGTKRPFTITAQGIEHEFQGSIIIL